MGNDPREIIDNSPMRPWQVAAVGVTVCLNALDGFDVLSISFASPGIAKDWGMDRAALGIVLSMELLGMAVGSILLGGIADKIGRRKTILCCLVMMAIGMFLAAGAKNVYDLSAYRVLTGLGIGGMLASTNALVAEFSNLRWRKVSLALMVVGYPLGAVIGGSISQILLTGGEWRDVFEFGAIATVAFIPLVWFLIPESVDYLAQKRAPGALDQINATLTRFGHATIRALPIINAGKAKQSALDVFSPALIRTTTLVTLTYSFHVITFYFILKWIPKIVTDMGFEPSQAAGVLVFANIGGAIGGAIFGLFAQRYGLRKPTLFVLIMSSLLVVWFGSGQADLQQMKLVVLTVGLFTNAAIVGLYAIFAQAFPTHVRATGTGVAIGIGRGFSWLAPILAGFLFQWGFGLQGVAALMAVGSLLAAVCLWQLKFQDEGMSKA